MSRGFTSIVLEGGEACSAEVVEKWRKGESCDLTVVVEERVFQLHKLVLERAGVELGGESGGTADGEGRIVLREVEADAFAAALDWLYTGRCAVAKDDLGSVLQVAVRLRIGALKTVSTDAIFREQDCRQHYTGL